MNLLIADDEIVAIQGILDSVDLKAIGFDQIFIANSYAQAMGIFLNYDVDVLLCDIEMPFGNGLDLVKWVNAHKPGVAKIFLSCHDKFDYARQAISLECLDYILKPATPDILTNVLTLAIQKVEADKEKKRYLDYGRVYLDALSQQGQKSMPESMIDKVEMYINSNLAKPLTVDALASMFCLSPDHLTRLFRKKHGKTIIHYITEKRLQLAVELLRQGGLPLNVISATVGYRDYSYFARIFKKRFGITPGEFQQREQGAVYE